MVSPIESQLSDEDYQLSSINELGTPLSVYKVKPIYVSLMWGGGLFLFVLGMIELLLLLLAAFMGWHRTPEDGTFPLLITLLVLLPISSFCTGLFILHTELPKIQKQRITVCEHGLLKITQKSRSRQINVLYWQDVLTIRRFYGRYEITRCGHEIFILDILYQRAEDLIELIKEQSGKM